MALTLLDLVRSQTAATAQSLRRRGMALAVLAVAMFLLGASIGCAIAALWLAVAPYLGPALAALTSALALLLMAAGALLMARRLERHPAIKGDVLSSADLSKAFRTEKATWLTAALTAGLVAGGQRPGRSKQNFP